MASNYKAKKVRNPEIRAHIGLGFKTLINNDACVKSARELKWIAPVILVILSLILALLPNFISNMKVDYGSSIIGTSGFGIESGLTAFGDAANASNLGLYVEKATMKDVTPASWDAVCNEPNGQKWYQYTVFDYQKQNDDVRLEVFFNNTEETDKSFIDSVLANQNPYNKIERGDWNKLQAATPTYCCSVVIFGKTTFFIKTFTAAHASGFNTYYGAKYDKCKDGFQVKSLCDKTITSLYDRTVATKTAWQSFVSNAFESFKIGSAWQYTGIMGGVYAAMVLLLGVVLFLVTRGKRNPFRIITFWECQKIGYWAAFSPGLLSLILGFIFASGIGQFLFIFLFGMRTMWLSMKSLRPEMAA